MIKLLVRQKENEPVPEPKAIIPLRSLAGAVISVLVVLFTSVYIIQTNGLLMIVWVVLEAPGMIVFREIHMLTNIKSSMSNSAYYDVFANLIIYGVSSIPFAIIGWLIGSSNKWTRVKGITLLVLYIPISVVAGIIIYAMSV